MTCDYQSMQKMLQEDQSLARAVDYVLGYNALHWAAKYGNCDVVKLIAGTYNVDPNIRTRGAVSGGAGLLHNRIISIIIMKLLSRGYIVPSHRLHFIHFVLLLLLGLHSGSDAVAHCVHVQPEGDHRSFDYDLR